MGERAPDNGKHPWGGLYCRCRVHKRGTSKRGRDTLSCTREIGFDRHMDYDDVQRQLKWWCCQSPVSTVDRRQHMNGVSRAPEMLPDDEQLVAQRATWDTWWAAQV